MGALDMSLDEVITKSGDGGRRGKGSGKNWESSKTDQQEKPKAAATEGKSKDDLLSMSLDEMISATGSAGRRKGGGGSSWGKGGGKGKGGYSYSYSGGSGGEGSSWSGGAKEGGWSGGYDGGRGRGGSSSWAESGGGGGGGMRGWGDSWSGGGGGGSGGGWSGGREATAWTEHDDRKGGGGGGGWWGAGGGGSGGGDWGSSGYDRGTKRPREAARAPKTPTRIKVTNIPSDLTKDDIKEAFESEAGPTTRVEMSKGTAYIQFEDAEGAKMAVETFDRGELNGKIISVTYDQ